VLGWEGADAAKAEVTTGVANFNAKHAA